MSQKMNKSKKQNATKWETLRVSLDFKTAAVARLKEINAKETGRNVKMDEMLSVALAKIAETDVQMLRERSLSPSDRQEILRRKYAELHGPTSDEDYIGFTMTPGYADFLREHSHLVAVA